MAESYPLEKLSMGNRKIIIDGGLVNVSQILQSSKLQKKLINENPEEAIKLYESNETPSLGKLLVKYYKRENEYDSRVALIARKHSMQFLDEPISSVKQEALNAENRGALVGMGDRKITDSRAGRYS